MAPPLSPEQHCARAHELLQAAMALLDAGFRAPELRPLRANLIERGTVACANARLRRLGDLRQDLEQMLDEAAKLPASDDDDNSVARLQRLIQSALSPDAEPDV